MKKSYLFVVDGEVQSSLFEPWRRAYLHSGAEVDVFDFEAEFKKINFIFKNPIIVRIFNWTRREKHRFWWQYLITFILMPLYWFTRSLTNNSLKKKANENYDLILVFKGLDLMKETLIHLNSSVGKTVCLNGDSPYNMYSSNKNVLNCIEYYDVFICWSKIEQEMLQHKGFKNTYYLPFSCEKTTDFEEIDIDFDLQSSVIFIGVWDAEREHFLEKLGLENLIIFGPGWEKSKNSFIQANKICAKRLSLGQMAYIYDKSLCALNIMRPQNAGSHNMKTFEITGMGCYLIAPNTIEHRNFFDDQDAVALFDHINDIPGIIQDISSISTEINEMKIKRTRSKVLKNHSYRSRVEQLDLHVFGGS